MDTRAGFSVEIAERPEIEVAELGETVRKQESGLAMRGDRLPAGGPAAAALDTPDGVVRGVAATNRDGGGRESAKGVLRPCIWPEAAELPSTAARRVLAVTGTVRPGPGRGLTILGVLGEILRASRTPTNSTYSGRWGVPIPVGASVTTLIPAGSVPLCTEPACTLGGRIRKPE